MDPVGDVARVDLVGARPDRRTTDTRRRIEDAALDLFVLKGFTATSLRDIAEAVGLTKAAVYYHFKAKSDIARAVMQPFIDDVNALFARLEQAPSKPRAVLEIYFDTLVPHRRTFLALLRDASLAAFVDLERPSARWIDQLSHLLLGPDVTPEGRVRAVHAASGLSRTLLIDDVPLETIRRAAVDAALGALGR